MPTLSRRKRLREASERRVRRCPSTQTSPEVGRSTAATRWRSVLFPQPLGPIKATNSPGADLERHVRQSGDVAGGAVIDLGDVDETNHCRSNQLSAISGQRANIDMDGELRQCDRGGCRRRIPLSFRSMVPRWRGQSVNKKGRVHFLTIGNTLTARIRQLTFGRFEW